MTETTAVKRDVDYVEKIRNYLSKRQGGKLGGSRAKKINEAINQINKND